MSPENCFSVRDGRPEDASAIAAIDRACFSEPDSERVVLDTLRADNMIVKVVDTEDGIVSYCSAVSVLDEIQIVNVATSPSHTARGYATAALRAVLETAAERGAVTASLEVRVSNSAAIRIYGSAGFRTCGVRRNFYKKPTEDALVMVADLGKK